MTSSIPRQKFMKNIPGRFTKIIFLLLAELAIISFTTGTPALAETFTYFGLTHPSEIVLPGTPWKTQIASERYSLFQLLGYPDRKLFPLAGIAEGRKSVWLPEADASPEYIKPENISADSHEPSIGKSYLIAGLEILGFIAAMNGVARFALSEEDTYDTNLSSIWDNLVHGDWSVDNDKFSTNQLRHPYQGVIYHGIARSTGLDFRESLGYTFLGSLLWEMVGEVDNPSPNDQVASGIAGSFLGEPLFRMANLLLEGSGPGFWRELGAAVLSPPAGFNRHVFGKRFDVVFPSLRPAVFWHLDLGANMIAHHSGPETGDLRHEGAIADFSMEYGLPGKPGYHYTRPFDYFQVEASAATNYSNTLGALSARGLLFGREYTAGDLYKGVWGLYGSYDYLATDPARVSSTAVSIGTTAQWRPSPDIALQGTVLGGLGYGAGGEISGFPERSYRYGGTAQGVLDLRFIFGDLAMLDFKGRQYYISDVLATSPEGSETITRLKLGFTVRIHDRHAMGLQYQFSSRDTHFRSIENRNQEVGMVSLVYTFLSDEGFGAVDFSNFPAR